jgi:dihydrofolate reductase
MSVTSIDADHDNLTLTVIADFDAPIDRVWELWSDPRKLERWWGPPGYPATFVEHDLRPGGEAAYLQMGMSLDGRVAVPSGDGLTPVMEGVFGLPTEDPELTRTKLAWIRKAGAHLMGRVTYEQMAAYWPSSTSDYAAPMNEIPKVVFSRELASADWPESRIARGDLAGEIAALKREAGKDLIAYGGASFAQSLARLDLVDEYRLTVHPVAVVEGEPLFKDSSARRPLKLIEARTFKSAALHIYERA